MMKMYNWMVDIVDTCIEIIRSQMIFKIKHYENVYSFVGVPFEF
jgi:hypothetical protein